MKITLTPRQVEGLKLLGSGHLGVLFHGGTRSGKTLLFVLAIIARALKYPGSRHLLARLHLAHAKTSLWLETLLPLIRGIPDTHPNHSDLYVTFANGSEIWIGGFDDKERLEKILGHEYCVDPDALVLTAGLTWVPAHSLRVGHEIIGFPEDLDGHIRLKGSMIERCSEITATRYRIVTDKGATIISEGHAFVVYDDDRRNKNFRSWSWRQARDLQIGNVIRFAATPWTVGTDRITGWAAGILDGEGWASKTSGTVGIGQNAGAVFDMFCRFLIDHEVAYRIHSQPGVRCKHAVAKGLWASLRLLGITQPVRLDSRGLWEDRYGFNQRNDSRIANVLGVECLGKGKVTALQTTTRTLIADGFLGHNSTILYNEVSQISYDAVTLGMTRLAQNIPGMRCVAYFDCNPPSPLHWAHKLFIEKVDPTTEKPLERPELWGELSMNPIDNAANLPPHYIRDVLDQLPQKDRDRLRDGKWVRPTGMIFSFFDDAMIVNEVPEDMECYTVGVDFGLNMAAALVGWRGDEVWFVDELTMFNATSSTFAEEMRKKWKGIRFTVYGDPSGGERLEELDALKADNSVEPGLDWLNAKMERGLFKVARKCRAWLSEVYDYRRDELGRVIKTNDHVQDAGRYGSYTHRTRGAYVV